MYTNRLIEYVNHFLIEKGFKYEVGGDKTAKKILYTKIKNDIFFGIEFLPIIYKNNHFWGFSFVNKIPILENITSKILFKYQLSSVKAEDISYSILFKYDEKICASNRRYFARFRRKS
ncbi:Uncharacterised protein [Algoriella xinjiangensis]|uniref:hypothetical protein n=1 Tax=Algoriella xinjiangensis TaxID=684065 RepID=UPI000F63CF11|nr:hypothetical protein [Algoriella xinjiangensis]VDH15451.1 Uncharacterised protein [Algoriella xinjiangensis]